MKSQQIDEHDLMSVGELAKKMGVSVRTLQYYDLENILSPSAQSSGKRRRYTNKDMIKLHQILSLKSLGFSLHDIKNRLISLDTPQEVDQVLQHQANTIREKITKLTNDLSAIEALREEVRTMHEVNFKKYADIITNLHMNNDYYWLIKYFDEDTLNTIRNQFDNQSGMVFMQQFKQLEEQLQDLLKKKLPPQDIQMQALAKQFWDMIVAFTKEDEQMLAKLMELGDHPSAQIHWIQQLNPALELYLESIGYTKEIK